MELPKLMIAKVSDFTEENFSLMEKHISEERKRRVSKFCFELDRQMGILSEILVRNVSNFQGVLKKEESGMPYIELKNGDRSFCSISHSDGIVLTAYSNNYAIGIDIQSSLPDIILTEGFFTKQEISQVIAHKIESHALWTMKESVSKLLGVGLQLDFSKIFFERKSENSYQTIVNGKKIYTLCHKFYDQEVEYYFSVSTFHKIHILPVYKVKYFSELLF